MGQRRRIAAYGMCLDRDGRVLLARGSEQAAFTGVWQIPGGGIEHGEHPADGVVREFAEETGLAVTVAGLRAVVSDVLLLPDGVAEHTDRIIYDVRVTGGVLRDEPDGTTDLASWHSLDEAKSLALMPFTAELLGVPVVPLATPPPGPPPPPVSGPPRGQRFAAYGLATDPPGRVLLTLIAPGFPGAGHWHLPGGGTDFGEQPATALERELAEEAGQVGRVTGLIEVNHHHNPAARGPEGYPMDWHAVRVIYRVVVDAPTEAVVTEAAGGSTADARWFTPAEAAQLSLTVPAADALAYLLVGGDGSGE
ncbi:NUDIX domain-containing protein [Actinomycetes bacterium KLBMP 9797]